MLESRALQFQYNQEVKFAFPDMSCAAGETLLLLGGSGTGKTTLLHLLAGLRKPQSGKVFINGTDITGLKAASLDKFRGENVGIVFQSPHFVKSVSVLKNLTLANHMLGEPDEIAKAEALLKALGLEEKKGARPQNLSAGQQQRVSIARAVMNSPKVLFADEPTSALDDASAQQVVQLLEQQARKLNAALIIVTHDSRLKSHFPNQISL